MKPEDMLKELHEAVKAHHGEDSYEALKKLNELKAKAYPEFVESMTNAMIADLLETPETATQFMLAIMQQKGIESNIDMLIEHPVIGERIAHLFQPSLASITGDFLSAFGKAVKEKYG